MTAQELAALVVCPACRGDLAVGVDGELRCATCERSYPVVLGIPDLRLFPDPYIALEADREKGRHLAERFDDFDFAGLVDYYYRITPAVPARHARQYALGLVAGEARAARALKVWEDARVGDVERSHLDLLDVGCGTAPLLVAAAGRFRLSVGLDIAFRWLVVAKKRLEEAGLDTPLICACAEALPFRDERFHRVVADSTLEHLRDQREGLAEMRRVLVPGGRLFLAVANRLNLGPDPHLGLWGASLLPARWADALARRQGAVPPKRRLLTARSLTRLLRTTGFGPARLLVPTFPEEQRTHLPRGVRLMLDAYHLAVRLPGLRRVATAVGPRVQASCEKPSDE